METSRWRIITFIIVILVIIPTILLSILSIYKFKSIIDLIIFSCLTIIYMIFIFTALKWPFLNYYLRYVILILFVSAVIFSFINNYNLPFFTGKNTIEWIISIIVLSLIAVLFYLNINILRGFFYDEKPIELSFPFKNGSFVVFEGGNGRNSRFLNYHYKAMIHGNSRVNKSMTFATDIVKIDNFGNAIFPWLSKKLENHKTYHETLYSPCDGEIIEVLNELPNQIPFTGPLPYNVGNHIVIKTDDYYIIMGHLQKGSIRVKKNDKVKRGDELGKIGNSGWTLNPHLHMQAMKVTDINIWQCKGAPILFGKIFPVKNKLFKF